MDSKAASALVERVIDRAELELGYTASGIRMVLQAFARTRPDDLAAVIRIMADELRKVPA